MNTIKYRTKEGTLEKVKITQSIAVILRNGYSPYRSMRITSKILRADGIIRIGGKYKHEHF